MAPTNPPTNNPSEAVKHSKMYDATDHLLQSLARKAGEMIKVRRIPETSSYRVNWYYPCVDANRTIPGLTVRYIRQSQFLNCSLNDEGTPVITYPIRQ